MNNNIYLPRLNSVRGALLILATLAALWFGLALAAPAQGATLHQDAKGDITGQVTVNGQATQGVAVELRQRTNGGQDTALSSTATDGTGTYHFANQPSAPNDAFYYIRFTGSKSSLSAWYSFPIIYLMGSQVTVPAVDVADVKLVSPAQNGTLALPGKLEWTARKMGETYRVFVYEAGKLDKPVLDSGSLGTGTEYPLGEGALQPGKYEAVVQVRDAVAGYGQSRTHFLFSVGAAANQATTGQAQTPGTASVGDTSKAPAQQPAGQAQAPTTEQNGTANPEAGSTAAPAQNAPESSAQSGRPDIKLNLSADKTSVDKGGNIIYKVEIQNAGSGTASGLVVTDNLPDGVGVDTAGVKAGDSKVTINNGTVVVNVGDIAAGTKTTIEIPAKVADSAGGHVSNQASATYAGASDAVQSNAYIAEVAEPVAGPAQQPVQQPEQQPQSQPQQQQPAQQAAPAAPANNQPVAPQTTQPQAPPKAAPQQAPVAQSGAASGAQAPASSAHGSTKEAPAQPNTNTKAHTNSEARVSAPAQKKAASVPQTGGSFPVVLAVLLLVATLLARYLRGYIYRRA